MMGQAHLTFVMGPKRARLACSRWARPTSPWIWAQNTNPQRRDVAHLLLLLPHPKRASRGLEGSRPAAMAASAIRQSQISPPTLPLLRRTRHPHAGGAGGADRRNLVAFGFRVALVHKQIYCCCTFY
ncbi:hypothetical protein DAI22_02g346550 [Oryza sativa Japonica Group]|nr:hypothetical protein DAI22_02g346550 [Oryza sativa Japonica Group]